MHWVPSGTERWLVFLIISLFKHWRSIFCFGNHWSCQRLMSWTFRRERQNRKCMKATSKENLGRQRRTKISLISQALNTRNTLCLIIQISGGRDFLKMSLLFDKSLRYLKLRPLILLHAHIKEWNCTMKLL